MRDAEELEKIIKEFVLDGYYERAEEDELRKVVDEIVERVFAETF